MGDRFVEHSSANYSLEAKTVFSELVGNVTDHSESQIPGLAGLQVYRPYNKPKHIQTVISDSGLGIHYLENNLTKRTPEVVHTVFSGNC